MADAGERLWPWQPKYCHATVDAKQLESSYDDRLGYDCWVRNCHCTAVAGGGSTQIIQLSKSKNTKVWKYSVSGRSPAFIVNLITKCKNTVCKMTFLDYSIPLLIHERVNIANVTSGKVGDYLMST